jgi:YHYH protein
MTKTNLLAFLGIATFTFFACSKDNDEKANDVDNGNTSTEVPEVYKKIYGASNITSDGTYVYIKSNAVPDHKSPYFKDTQWESTMYVNDTRPGFVQAPNNKVSSINYTFKIPLNPKPATTTTPLGAATIGVAINGVPFFNQYQMQGIAITPGSGEYVSFDLYGGHPTPFNEYHYHIEPNYLTSSKGSSALMGFLLDGYPVYGPVENGTTLTSSNLDQYHGHSHATADYPNGTYHYHITADAPYINGNGYYGTPGTWSK